VFLMVSRGTLLTARFRRADDNALTTEIRTGRHGGGSGGGELPLSRSGRDATIAMVAWSGWWEPLWTFGSEPCWRRQAHRRGGGERPFQLFFSFFILLCKLFYTHLFLIFYIFFQSL
jgi:hypothetical protein